LPDGACADPGSVAYVNLGGTDNPSCSAALPCATIAKALSTARPYLKLHGEFNQSVTINNQSVVILADPGTTLTRTSNGNIVTISGGSNVEIYDLAISGGSGNGAAAVSLPAGASPSLTLSRVSISRNDGTGGAVLAAGGTINIYQSTISDNTGGGVAVNETQFDIENNFITGNGSISSSYGGVSISQPGANSRLGFNTIAGNLGPSGSPAGVTCGFLTQDLIVSNNIIFDNIVAGGGQQVGGAHCLWTYSDIGPSTVTAGAGNLNVDPLFVNANGGNFHLQSSSPVIDKADPNSTLSIDIDGDPRPQGNGRDVGADEYKSP
jgi:hypothetical protein